MLKLLRVENVAVVECVEVPLAPGFNVVTGETGAGKSVLLTALSWATGGRVDTGLVREGAKAARVDALFVLPAELARTLGYDAAEILLSREVSRDGRSVARVDGRPVAVQQQRRIGGALLAMVGQGEGFLLRAAEEQEAHIDAFGGLMEDVRELERRTDELAATRRSLAALGGDERQRRREAERLAYELEEIDGAALTPGEEEELRQQLAVLARAEAIRAALWEAQTLVGGGQREAGAYDLLARAAQLLERRAFDLEGVRNWLERANALLAELSDLGEEAQRLAAGLEEVRSDRTTIEGRLERLGDLKRKYGPSIDEILRYREEAAQRLMLLTEAEAEVEHLNHRLAALEREVEARRRELRSRRRRAGEDLAHRVNAELESLGLGHARLSYQDAERASFLFSANPGERPRPLGEVASGGELHRLLIALAVVGRHLPPTLVFDEVDTGVGGEAAQAVADRLRVLGRESQVLAVTHQAVLAARADWHVRLTKTVRAARTYAAADVVDGEERLLELARMLSGRRDEAALAHARALLSSA
jgi:DNA repair protein RecN (Recombination protein N)